LTIKEEKEDEKKDAKKDIFKLKQIKKIMKSVECNFSKTMINEVRGY